MSADYNERGETVFGAPVVFRRLTLCERRIDAGENRGGFSSFALEGRIDGGPLELWKANGRWRENDKAHPSDLAITADAHA
jgi:hypothetical protein